MGKSINNATKKIATTRERHEKITNDIFVLMDDEEIVKKTKEYFVDMLIAAKRLANAIIAKDRKIERRAMARFSIENQENRYEKQNRKNKKAQPCRCH